MMKNTRYDLMIGDMVVATGSMRKMEEIFYSVSVYRGLMLDFAMERGLDSLYDKVQSLPIVVSVKMPEGR